VQSILSVTTHYPIVCLHNSIVCWITLVNLIVWSFITQVEFQEVCSWVLTWNAIDWRWILQCLVKDSKFDLLF